MSDKNLVLRNGTWYARAEINGRDIRRSLRTGSKVVARQRLKFFLESIEHIRFTGEPRHTWKAAVVEWSSAITSSVKPNVAKRYKVSLRQVRASLDDLYIDEIGVKTIARVVKDRRDAGATNATIRRDLTAISSVLAYCVAQGWVESNAAKAYDRDVIRERRDPIVLPDPADIDVIVAMAPGNLARLIRFAQFTGMRQEEVGSLERGQIRGEVVDLWKSKTDRPRAVPLDRHALGTLAGSPQHITSKWVFWHSDGARYANLASRFRELMRRAVKQEAVGRAFRFHDLRHWYAVDYLRRGGNLYVLQKLLGHASIKTTEMYLDYLTPEEQQRAKYGQVGA
jgi:integrase